MERILRSLGLVCLLNFIFIQLSFAQQRPVNYGYFSYKKSGVKGNKILDTKNIQKFLTGNIKKDAEVYILHSLAEYLDAKGVEFYFYPHTPWYREDYIVNFIFQMHLSPEEIQKGENKEYYFELLKDKFSKDKALIPVFNINWQYKLLGYQAGYAYQKIKDSGVQWPNLTIGLKKIPDTYNEFLKEVLGQADKVYQGLKRKRVLDYLLEEDKAGQRILPSEQDISQRYFKEQKKLLNKRAVFYLNKINLKLSDKAKTYSLSLQKKLIKDKIRTYQNLANDIEKKYFNPKEKTTIGELMALRKKVMGEIENQFHQLGFYDENFEINSSDIDYKWVQGGEISHEQNEFHTFSLSANLGGSFLPKMVYLKKNDSLEVNLYTMYGEKPLEPTQQEFMQVKEFLKNQIISERYQKQREHQLINIVLNKLKFTKDFGISNGEFLDYFYQSGRRNLSDALSFNSKDFNKGKKLEKVYLNKKKAKMKGKDYSHSKDEVVYRLPDMYNTNPLAGRLYVQPIGPYEHKVIEGLKIDASVSTSGEYNRFFHDGTYGVGKIPKEYEHLGDIPYHNSRAYNLRVSYGYKLKGFKLESGVILRTQQDSTKDTEMSIFLLEFHKLQGNSPGHIPSPNLNMSGVVGNNQTLVIGDEGQVYLGSADLYTKLQVLEKGDIKWIDNLAVKATVRIPIKNDPFNNFGAAVSMGLDKEIYTWLSFVGAASLGYQDLKKGDFDADNIDVQNIAWDVYVGLVWDPGKKGGFYMNAGVRFSNSRISYVDNPTSSRFANVLLLSANYETKNGIVIYFTIGEEIPNLDGALEPDLVAYLGLEYTFGKKRRKKEQEYHE